MPCRSTEHHLCALVFTSVAVATVRQACVHILKGWFCKVANWGQLQNRRGRIKCFKKEYKSKFEGAWLLLNSSEGLLLADLCSEQYEGQWIELLSVFRELSGWVSIFDCTSEHIVFDETLVEKLEQVGEQPGRNKLDWFSRPPEKPGC